MFLILKRFLKFIKNRKLAKQTSVPKMFTIIEKPKGLPCSVEEIKKYAVVEHDEDDALFKNLIAVATSKAEALTGQILVDCVAETTLFYTGGKIKLPNPTTEIISVSDGSPDLVLPSEYKLSQNTLSFKGAGGQLKGKNLIVRFRAGYPIVDGVWQGSPEVLLYIKACTVTVYDNRQADPYQMLSGLLSTQLIFSGA